MTYLKDPDELDAPKFLSCSIERIANILNVTASYESHHEIEAVFHTVDDLGTRSLVKPMLLRREGAIHYASTSIDIDASCKSIVTRARAFDKHSNISLFGGIASIDIK